MDDSDQSPRPPERGLYDASFEHDACGVGFLAHLKGIASHDLIDRSLLALERMTHRGATGAESESGDGAGLLLQIPDALFRDECAAGRLLSPDDGHALAELPAAGQYGVGLFLSAPDRQGAALARMIFAMVVRQEGQRLLGWRRVPTDSACIGLQRVRWSR